MVTKTKFMLLQVMIAAALAVGPQTAALADTTTGNIHVESNALLDANGVTVIVDVTCASTDVNRVGDVHVEVTQPNSPFGPADGAGDRGFLVTPGQSQKIAVEVFSPLFDVGSATATASAAATPSIATCTTATDTRTIQISS